MSGSQQHPAWFGAVMGTGAVALALALQAATWNLSWLSWVAFAVLLVASVLALLLLPRYLRRLGDLASLRTELADPGHGAMLATLPAGLLVLSAAWGRVGPVAIPAGTALWIDAVLLTLGVLASLWFGVTWASSILRSAPGLNGVNGGWLIPPVMNLLVPLGLAPLIAANAELAPLLVLVGFAFYGIGVLLFLVVLTLLVGRLVVAGPKPAAMAPSMWIPLAPAGMIGLALTRLLLSAQDARVPGMDGGMAGVLVSAMGVGFGLWWAAFAWRDFSRMRADGPLPAHPGWWGFVFPIGAMTLSVATIGTVTGVVLVQVVGLIATIVLLAVWGMVAARTVSMLRARPARS